MALACPYVSRGSARTTKTPFNEGVSVPKEDWARLVAKNPALASKDATEKAEAVKKAMTAPGGELRDYRRR